MKYLPKKLLFISSAVNILYVLFFYSFFERNFESLSYSFIHSILSAIIVSSLATNINKAKRVTLGYLLVYVVSVYFQLSIVKYTRTDTFPRFITDNRSRFYGTIIVFISLYICILIQKKQIKKNDLTGSRFQRILNKSYTYGGVTAWCLSIICLFYYTCIYNYSNSIYLNKDYNKESIAVTIVVNVIFVLAIYFSSFYIDSKNIYTFIPLLLIICSLLFYTLKTGSRAVLIAKTLIALFILCSIHKFKIKKFFMCSILSPWLLLVMTYAAFKISGRYSFDLKNVVARNIAYRFDLSDLAIMFLKSGQAFKADFSEIQAGILNCIPTILTTKYKGFSAYKIVLDNAGLITDIDYSDSFFSMGASAFGIIGMLFFIPVLFILYERLDMYLEKYGRKGLYIKAICIGTLGRIETEWTSFIPELRNLIISVLISLVLFHFLGKKIHF